MTGRAPLPRAGAKAQGLISALTLLLLGLGACAAPHEGSGGSGPGPREHLGKDFGNAVSHNAEQHIIDPIPAQAAAGAPEMDGARAAGAIRRYRSGEVTAPETLETSEFGDRR